MPQRVLLRPDIGSVQAFKSADTLLSLSLLQVCVLGLDARVGLAQILTGVLVGRINRRWRRSHVPRPCRSEECATRCPRVAATSRLLGCRGLRGHLRGRIPLRISSLSRQRWGKRLIHASRVRSVKRLQTVGRARVGEEVTLYARMSRH